MFFDRRAKRNSPHPRDAREHHRHPLPPDHPLRMQIVRADGQVVDVLPVDLTARGAGFRAWADLDLREDEVFDVLVSSDADGWVVQTPGMVRHGTIDEDTVDWGVEFINLGNLYGQWDNVLGRYFNRRADRRVAPDLDRKIAAEVYRDERPTTAAVHDISARGIGLAMRQREVPGLARDEVLEIGFQLPRSRRKLRGHAVVRQLRQSGVQVFLGLEFDLSDPEGFVAHQREIVSYCDKRARAESAWEESWREVA